MKRYWVRNYELRDLGSWPEHQVSREHDPFGPGIPKQVYLAADVEAVIEQADKAIKGAIGKTDDGYVICLGYHPPTEERDGEFEWLEVVPKSDRDTLQADLARKTEHLQRCVNELGVLLRGTPQSSHTMQVRDDAQRELQPSRGGGKENDGTVS